METVIGFLNTLAGKGVKLSVEADQLNCYAQSGVLSPDIRDGIVRYKAEIIALLEGRGKRQQGATDTSSRKSTVEFPLSAGQKGLYVLQKLQPGMSAYNVPVCFRIKSPVDTETLAAAWGYVLEQFPILTTRVIEREGELYHRLDDDCKTTIQQRLVDLGDEQEFLAFLRDRAKRPFDLNRGPLTRIELFIRDKQKPILLLTVHHIVFDGTSAIIVLKYLLAFYQQLCEGKQVQLSRDLPGYQEFVAWEEAMLVAEEGKVHASYWRHQLDGELPTLQLLPDLPRLASPSFEGRTLAEDLPEELSRWVRGFTKSHSLPPAVLFLAVFQLLLRRYTNQDDIIVGMPVMGRVAQKFAAAVGYFINMVPILTRCEERLSLNEFLRRVQGTVLDALYHSSYPFPLMLDNSKPREWSKSPIFQVTFAYQNFVKSTDFMSLLNQQKLQLETVSGLVQEGDSDLGLEIFEGEELFRVHLKYNPDLYAQGTMSRLFGHYVALLTAISTNPDLSLQDYSLISKEENQLLLVEYNNTEASYAEDKCIHHLFTEQVALNPNRIAVACGAQEMSYQELNRKSHDLALYLQSIGVRPDHVVGLCLERSLDVIIALLGILQAGGAYMPLDPGYPDDRLTYMLRDSQAAFVLTEEKLLDRLKGSVKADTQVVTLDREWPEIEKRVAALKTEKIQLEQKVKPHHLAYVIYTSGSTGEPKGVAIEHHSTVTLLQWASEVYSREELAGVLASTSICFDLSVYEIFVTLSNGGKVILVPNALGLLSLSNKQSVTLINTVPSAMEELVRLGAIPDSVKTVNLAGEPLSPKLVDKIYDTTGVTRVYDLYGPSEDTTYSTYVLRKKNAPQTIGRPIANTQVYILDPYNHPQPVGVPGELHIAGDGLARGYLNRPDLTREKFVANPFKPQSRMYKTGDLARWLEDGNIQYLGRIDTQVKIRGFRIELGEVEARLNQHPGIRDSAVIAQGQEGNKQLVAFYRAKETQADHIVHLPNEELRAHLSKALPEYMVPAAFVSLRAIPLNPNGKVDRRGLARMDVTMGTGREYVAPRNERERKLVAIWAQVLNVAEEKIGINDNFFELGGHSLLATQLISKIRHELEVDLPLTAVFEHSSVGQFAELIGQARKSDIPPIRPIDRTKMGRLPLSFAQERIWFIQQMEPDTAGYNLPGAVTIRGELDISQLEQAFNLIIARHENLRTVFPSPEGQPQQQILESLDFKLERIDLSGYESREERDNRAKEICQAEATTAFDLARGPLIRGKVIKLGEQEQIVMLNMHHIISDGWSLGVLIKELDQIMEALGQGRDAELAPLPIQYVDYSVWQRTWLEEGGILKQQLAYWQEKLAGVAENLELVTDYPRPSVQSFAGASQAFVLEAGLTEQLKRLAEHEGGTLYMVLLAAFKTLLYRYTRQSDICVGSPIANRQYSETEGLIGMFVNTLALRSQIGGEDTFAGLLAKVKATCLEAYQHQDAPFEKVVDLLHPQRNTAINPLFQVMVALQNGEIRAPGQHIQPYPLESGISKFDLIVEFTETAEGLAGSMVYSTALYKRQTIERMAEHFIRLCQAMVVTPTAMIRDLNYLGEAEKHRLLVEYNNTRADYPKDKCIHQLFMEQVERTPNKTAVVFGDQTLSYQELFDKCSDLALYLQAQGLRPDGLVCVCMERSLNMVVGLLGILQAGGAYVPLDPGYPDERLAYMLQDSRAAIVITDGKSEERVSSLLAQQMKLVALDKDWTSIVQYAAELRARNVQLRREVKSQHLAYVIYTSGSTGQPKGVMVEHRNLGNLVGWHCTALGLTENDISTCIAGVGFDASAWEIWPSLCIGATLTSPSADTSRDPEALLKWWARLAVDVSFLPTPLAEFAFARGITNAHLRILLVGGDRLHQLPAQPEPFLLINNYGPTECTVVATSGALQNCTAVLHIGKPISNTQIYILDPYRQPVPIGVAGEIYIGGASVARGYLNQPELSAEQFVKDPFDSDAQSRMYKTGDLARWLEDGNIQYLGRIDTQVKIRGFRIELGEIEARLNQHPGIRDSAVIAQGQEGNKQLVAFYRAAATQADQIVQVPNEELRRHLLVTLPEYMVPAAFVSLAGLPLNANGKVDRRVLARTEATIASGREYVEPRTETEKELVAIWAEVLNLRAEKIGVNDNFFELGGHSLSAVQVMAKINRQFNQLLPLSVMFSAPNIAALARLISDKEAPSNDILVPIQTNGNAPPVFAVPGAGGNVLSLHPLSRTLGMQQPFYGLQAVGLDGRALPLSSVEKTAQANVTALRTVQPHGPYILIGHSYGGVVAYEMARILLDDGEQVSSLILLDSLAPSLIQEKSVSDDATQLFEACMTIANLYAADLRVDIERLRPSTDENIQYAISVLNGCGLDINAEQFTAFYRVYQTNLLCYRTYKPSRLSREINISLYRATQEHKAGTTLPCDYGWNPLLRNPILTYDVEANHSSILAKVSIHGLNREY